MRPRFLRATMLLAAASIALLAATTAPAQAPAPRGDRSERIAGYLDRMVGSTGQGSVADDREFRDQIYQLLSRECAKVARANSLELRNEQEWLDNKVQGLVNRVRTARTQSYTSRQGSSASAARQREIEDLEVELALARLMHEEVGKCIEQRRAALQRGKSRTLRASWKTTCTDTPGVHMDSEGTIDLNFGEEAVTGTVQWNPSRTKLDVKGVYIVGDRSISLKLVRREALDEFRLSGQVTVDLTGITGGGEIVYGNTFEGCNIGPDPNVCTHTIRCSGRWASE